MVKEDLKRYICQGAVVGFKQLLAPEGKKNFCLVRKIADIHITYYLDITMPRNQKKVYIVLLLGSHNIVSVTNFNRYLPDVI